MTLQTSSTASCLTSDNKLGISRSSLFNKLRGSNEFSLSEAFNLSRILGMTVDELCRLAMKSD